MGKVCVAGAGEVVNATGEALSAAAYVRVLAEDVSAPIDVPGFIKRIASGDDLGAARIAAARTTRARPDRFSVRTGLRLCGIAEEPFWPLEKNSSTSRTSVRWR